MKLSPNLQSFLNLGYFIDYNNPKEYFNINNIDYKKYKDFSRNELLEQGLKIFRDSISHNYKEGQKHIVPLSGGLDSRALLAGLLEHTDASNISTITFGMPGTWDFEIGQKVSKKLGIKNTSFDLNKYEYSNDELFDISRRSHQQTVLFHHWPVWMMDKISNGRMVWSGFLGETITGSHQPAVPADNIDIAKKNFLNANRYLRSISLPDQDIYKILNIEKYISPESISYEEQLDFNIRQLRFIAPHLLLEGYNFKVPFAYQPLVSFFLSIPADVRQDQLLYKDLLIQGFPKAFSYITKTTAGLPLNAPPLLVYLSKAVNKIESKFTGKSKSVNYLNFNEKIREKEDLKNIIRENISDFNNRKILSIDLEKIFIDHINKKGNYYDILLLITSLEIHLKTGKVL